MADPITCACVAAPSFGSFPYFFDRLLAPAIVAGVFGGSAAYVLELYRGRREATTKIADSLRDDLKAAQVLVTEYWARAHQPGDEVIEARLIGLQSDIASTLALLDNVLKERVTKNMAMTVANLFDVLTGGDFQSLTRQADPSRIARCAKFTSELRVAITRARYRSISKIFGA